MADTILTRLEQLSLSSKSDEKLKLKIYHSRLSISGDFFLCKNGYIAIKDFEGKKFTVLKRIQDLKKNLIVVCLKCVDPRVMSSLSGNEDLSHLKRDYCEHASVCVLLWPNIELNDDIESQDDMDFVEVLKTKKNYACLVVPGSENVSKPGVVVVTARTLKPRCDRCLGKTCLHLTIHKDKYDEDVEGIIISPVGLKDKNSVLTKKSNEKDSEVIGDNENNVDNVDNAGNVGADAIEDVIPIARIPFPPTEEMKENIWRNSLLNNPFPEKKLIPKYDPLYTCPCGFKQNPKDPFAMNWVANDPVHIHHIRYVPDGRTGRLIAYFRPMTHPENVDFPPPCNHRIDYDGKSDNLLRVSKTGRKGLAHFVSLELMFKYLIDFFENGTSLKGFLASNTMFNSIVYNRNIEFNWFVLDEAYEKFIFQLDLPA